MDGHPLAQWTTAVCCAAQRLGRPVMNSRHCGRWMRDAGFVDVVERHFYWPLNTWPRGKKEKLIGMLAQQNLLDGVEAMSMALLTRGLKWSRGQVEVLLAGVRNDLKNRALHPYIDVYVLAVVSLLRSFTDCARSVVFYGRKPGSAYDAGPE